jgi:hypothetical protein
MLIHCVVLARLLSSKEPAESGVSVAPAYEKRMVPLKAGVVLLKLK